MEESKTSICDIERIMENRCYKALEEIAKIVQTPSFDDKDCFVRIEKIVVELEKLGSSGGSRHDFG